MSARSYVQMLLGKKGKPRQGAFDYAYSSMMKCGECGCSIVGKSRTKLIKSTGELKTYVYYYYTRKSEKRPCTQKIYTSLEKLEQQIEEELGNIRFCLSFVT